MEEKLDLGKPIQTRNGRRARVICTDRKFAYPMVVLVQNGNGGEDLVSYPLNGRMDPLRPHPNDLINMPERISVKAIFQANVFLDGQLDLYGTRDTADRLGAGRVACIPIVVIRDVAVGEGLEEPPSPVAVGKGRC